tara:strand:- start:67 stop:681 length:615 start_codon:yes stop_codon:yes gene_type:complete
MSNFTQNDLTLNKIPFVHSFMIDETVCDGLISYYKESSYKGPGAVGLVGQTGQEVSTFSKVSTDVSISIHDNNEQISAYRKQLFTGIDEYKERYPALSDNIWFWGVDEPFNIQHYEPNQGYLTWHCERARPKSNNRLLVFMTYLNDVSDGGQTEWEYLGLSVVPVKGLTIIWPTDWMYLHRGVTSPTQIKTIATGWFSFLHEQQ